MPESFFLENIHERRQYIEAQMKFPSIICIHFKVYCSFIKEKESYLLKNFVILSKNAQKKGIVNSIINYLFYNIVFIYIR